VAAPAIGLMVAGGLSAVTVLLWMAVWALGGTAAISDPEVMDALPAFGVLIGLGAVKLVLDLLTVYAGWQMRQLRSWGLCMAGSIIAMLPCFCCILGLPMGIWAVVVLIDDEVKRRFDGGYTPPPGGYSPPPPGDPERR
jgi:hypothetical protein